MSVAEALGVKVRTPNVDVRRSKYYAGLKLGDLGTYQSDRWTVEDSKRTPDGNIQDRFSPSLQDTDDPRKLHRSIGEDMYRLNADTGRQMRRGENGSMLKREPDLFMDTLGGPGGTVLRQNGLPPLIDPHFIQQQQQYQQYQATSRRKGTTPKEIEEYRIVQDRMDADNDLLKQQQRIGDLRKQIDHMKYKTDDEERGNQYSYNSFELPATARLNEGRSLDLGSTKGGSGAPIKDPWGKNVTRMPITLSRDDYGESKIKEDIPGKATFDLDFTNEESKPYYPWGGQGGGAPIRNRDGSIVTHLYGKLGPRNDMDGEIRRNKRRQEVLYNELKEGARQQKENRDELTRYMKAPHGGLAELLLAGRVGKPKRDAITGEIGQHHLPNSDVSKIKMNYQPIPMSQKRMYHDELIRMAEERQYQKQLEKLKEKQESNAHFHNMDSTWGAIGGGAPKHHVIRKKANLTNSLFFPQHGVHHLEDSDYLPPTGLGSFQYYQSPNMSYQKVSAEDYSRTRDPLSHTSQIELKSTARSSHRNLFDISSDQRMSIGIGGHPLAPYATSGME